MKQRGRTCVRRFVAAPTSACAARFSPASPWGSSRSSAPAVWSPRTCRRTRWSQAFQPASSASSARTTLLLSRTAEVDRGALVGGREAALEGVLRRVERLVASLEEARGIVVRQQLGDSGRDADATRPGDRLRGNRPLDPRNQLLGLF